MRTDGATRNAERPVAQLRRTADRVGAAELQGDVGAVPHEPRDRELGDRRLGARERPARERGDDAEADVAEDRLLDGDSCDLLAHARIRAARAARSLGSARQLGEAARDRPFADELRDRGALVEQRGLRDTPAVVHVADAIGVGDAHVGEEHLVEVRATRDLSQRPHLDAGRAHVESEVGDPLVLGTRRDRCARAASRVASGARPMTTPSGRSRSSRRRRAPPTCATTRGRNPRPVR